MAIKLGAKDKNKIIALINALIPKAKIYLFGSRARGTNSKWSDIDIALDAGRAIPQLDVAELKDIMTATNLPYKVEIVDFNKVNPIMREAIETDRVIWKR